MWIAGFLSAICFSLMGLVVAHFGVGISASEFLLGRSVFGLIFLSPLLLLSKSKNQISPLLILRGVIGTLAIIILFIMIQNVGPATANAIHYTSPLYVTLLSALFLKDKINFQKAGALLLVMMGVLLPLTSKMSIIDPSFLLLGILGAALSGISFFLLKLVTLDISEVAIYWMFCIVQLAVQIPLDLLSNNPVFHIRFYLLFSSLGFPCLVVGLLACAAQLLMNNSFKKLSASTASLLNLLSIPITVIIEFFVFDQRYANSQYLMILLILAGILLLRINAKDAKNSFQKLLPGLTT